MAGIVPRRSTSRDTGVVAEVEGADERPPAVVGATFYSRDAA
jgi:hypothetical protein